jgi:hypothetical protein
MLYNYRQNMCHGLVYGLQQSPINDQDYIRCLKDYGGVALSSDCQNAIANTAQQFASGDPEDETAARAVPNLLLALLAKLTQFSSTSLELSFLQVQVTTLNPENDMNQPDSDEEDDDCTRRTSSQLLRQGDSNTPRHLALGSSGVWDDQIIYSVNSNSLYEGNTSPGSGHIEEEDYYYLYYYKSAEMDDV